MNWSFCPRISNLLASSIDTYMCVRVYYRHIHTHTHTHARICMCVFYWLCFSYASAFASLLEPWSYKELYIKTWLDGEDFRPQEMTGSGDLLETESLNSSHWLPWKLRAGRGHIAGLLASLDRNRAPCIHEGAWVGGVMPFLCSWKRSWLWLLHKQHLGSSSSAQAATGRRSRQDPFLLQAMRYIRCRWHLG